MNILILSKRYPLQRDLITRPYGRFYNLSKYLSDQGHSVHLLLLDYKTFKNHLKREGRLTMESVSALPDVSRYLRRAFSIAKYTNSHWIIGYSDTYFGITAVFIATLLRKLSIVDAYDNYESYIPSFLPLHYLWHIALKNSTMITAAGPELLKKMLKNVSNNFQKGFVIPMAADELFRPMDKKKARKKMNLPLNRILIGYYGSFYKSRGVDCLREAFFKLSKQRKDVDFVLSGRRDTAYQFPANTRYLGYIEDDSMPFLVNSLDLAVAINKDSAFGNYSYPVKIYEALSCQTPIIASRTASTSYVLRRYPQLLFDPGSSEAIIQCIQQTLLTPPDIKPTDVGWKSRGKVLNKIIMEGQATGKK